MGWVLIGNWWTSDVGTYRTSPPERGMSVLRGEPEVSIG
jgi:hypothetical protein